MKKFLLSSAMLLSCVSMAMADVTVNVDDPSKCKLMNSNYVQVELQTGANTLPAGGYTLSYPAYDYKYTLKEVKLNGTVVEPSYGSYSFSEWGAGALKDGDVLDVTAAYEKAAFAVTVTGSLENTLTRADIYTYDGQYSYSNDSVANPMAFNAPAGYPAILYLNKSYSVDSVVVNGKSVEVGYDYRAEVTITQDTEVKVYARSKGCAYVTVDYAEMVTMRDASYAVVPLKSNEYVTVPEGNFTVSSAITGYMLSKVLVNNVEQAPSYNAWSLELSANDTVQIVAFYAEEYMPITINAPEGVPTSVTNQGVVVEDPTSFEALAGTLVELQLNTAEYRIQSITANGKSLSTYSPSFYATEPTTVEIVATKYQDYEVKLVLDDAENVTVYRGSSWYNDIYEGLVDGENYILLSESVGSITIAPNMGSEIDSVLVDGNHKSLDSYSGNCVVYISEPCTIEVFTHKIEYKNQATFMVHDLASANYSFSLSDADYQEYPDFVEGENTVKFNDEGNPFSLSMYGSDIKPAVYVNGEAVAPTYEGGTSYKLTLADGDFVEVFVLGGESQYVGIENVAVSAIRNSKVLKNGKLLINQNGRVYDLNGFEVK